MRLMLTCLPEPYKSTRCPGSTQGKLRWDLIRHQSLTCPVNHLHPSSFTSQEHSASQRSQRRSSGDDYRVHYSGRGPVTPAHPEPTGDDSSMVMSPPLLLVFQVQVNARKLHKSPKVSVKLVSKDKLSTADSADQTKTASCSTQDCVPVHSGTSSDVKLTTVSLVTKAPPGAIKVHKMGKGSTFSQVKKDTITASQSKMAEIDQQILSTETSVAGNKYKVRDSNSGSSNVETGPGSQVKKVTVTSDIPRATVSQRQRKRKTVREDAADGKARKSGEGAKHSRGTVAKDIQTSAKGRKVTATKASHVKENNDTEKERRSSLNSAPCSKLESKVSEHRTKQGTDLFGTEASLGTAAEEQSSVVTDRKQVLDVEMVADPPLESDVHTTDVMEDTEKTARTRSDHEEEDDDGTFNLTDLFDEEKQRAAWEEESQQPSKQKKKKKKKAKWWERKRKREKTGEAEEDVEEEGGEEGKVKKKKKESRPRPNYFVAIRVSNEEIHRGLEAVQQAVLEQEKSLLPAMIPLINMHITLLVTHLREEQVDRAKEALRLAKAPEFLRPENRLVLTFQGLGTFRNDVVFAKIQENDHLTSLRELAETVQTCFVEKEVCSKKDKGFEPHLTLMKTSRNFGKLRSKGIKKIDPKLYEEFNDQRFGEQVVEGLQLCSMLKKKETDGYYHTEEQVMFGLGLEHVVANSIASRAVREALLQLGCKLLEQQAKSNPEAALHTLSNHIARSVIQDALTALEVDENVVNTKAKVFSTDTMKAKVSELSESLGTALVTEAIQEASCKSVENNTSNKENEKNVDNVVDPSENVEGNSVGVSAVIENQNDLSAPSGENVKGQDVDVSQAETCDSLVGEDEDTSSCKTSKGQLKDLSEKLVKEVIEAALSKVHGSESKK
uniref:A-kinase anchor protein 7-like phosphoesterase domain-containing protein n=1 Tax=Branchiostoma floridae TaxID=7739 RepID=C3ZA70_BRAFL|eukprot:XP_002594647.1 hypothetical protein BRAFLDRAFT_131751 [Branchiostoma floridae]